MAQEFCHLHLHSEYSFLDGVIRIPDLAKACREKGMKAVALTDHGVMHGAVELIEACRKEEIKPIVGCEVYITKDRFNRDHGNQNSNSHLVLLALDDTGYRNLTTLVSMGYREGMYYKPRIDHGLLAKHSEGLVAMSACLRGELSQCLLSISQDRAKEIVGFYRDMFGPDRYFIELQDHGIGDQKKILPHLIDLSREMDVPLVATNDAHFLEPEDRYIQDVMICVQTNKKLTDSDRFQAYSQHHYFKSPAEMEAVFRGVPEALQNTVRIADMVTYDPSFDQFHFPEFKPDDGTSPEDYLKKHAREGLKHRLDGHIGEEHAKRLEYELKVICDMGFASYFLIVSDFVRWAKNQDIAVGPGRGSAAASLVSYVLDIIDIDPLQYGLMFERLLNPARKSAPDIDIDFDPHRRSEVIDYVTKTYGEEHVCQIITFNRLKARAALRDVGRVMDIPLGEVDKVAKLIGWKSDLAGSIKDSPDFKKAYESSDMSRRWIDTARRVEGLVRNGSIHAAGVIISAHPIWEHAPVQVMQGESGLVCQYSMVDAEKVGLVKMDFLGLRTLTYLKESVENIRVNRGIDIDLLEIPLDDKSTFRMLANGDVLGVFQMEGGGMRELLMAIAPDGIEDLMATIALFRPGPMENGLHHAYARRKNGKEPITYKQDLLKPILGPTYGILTYQEQISLILQALGGIDLATATHVMKLISKKKDRATIAVYRESFLKGAVERGIDRKTARDIWNEMEAFAGYGFNKAHSAVYGLVAYQTAYLKANYPLEFHAAYLSSEMHNQEKISLIIEELKGKKVEVLPPDVNNSHPSFRVEGNGIRYGLAAIKGVGIQAVESIANAREEGEPFTDIYDLASRVDLRLVNKGVLEALIKAGACDTLTGTRRAMLEAVADALEFGHRRQEDREKGQTALFSGAGASPAPALSDTVEFDTSELLKLEKESLGFYLSHHPLEDVWDALSEYTYQEIANLSEMRDGRVVRIGGMLDWVNKRLSKKMQNFAVFQIEDMTGKADGIMFPQAYTTYGGLMDTDAFVVMKARLRIDELESTDEETSPRKQVQLIAEEVWRYNPDSAEDNKWEQERSPDQATAEETRTDDIILDDDLDQYGRPGGLLRDASVNVFLDTDTIDRDAIGKLRNYLLRKRGPTPVKLMFVVDGREIVVNAGSNGCVVYSPELKETLMEIPGVRDVSLQH